MQFTLFSENQPKTFRVLRRLLTTYVPSWSRFLPRAGADPITITDTSVKSFETFLGWWRFQYYYCKDDKSCPWNRKTRWDLMDDNGSEYFDVDDPIMWGKKPQDVDFLADHAEAAVEMCIFAIRYEIPRLRLDAIERFAWALNMYQENETWSQHLPWIPSPPYVSPTAYIRAYKYIAADDPFRKLLWQGWYEFGETDEATLAMLPELVLALNASGLRPGGGIMGLYEPCEIHQHANNEEYQACDIRVELAQPGACKKYHQVIRVELQVWGLFDYNGTDSEEDDDGEANEER
jgi:hypothetical protein